MSSGSPQAFQPVLRSVEGLVKSMIGRLTFASQFRVARICMLGMVLSAVPHVVYGQDGGAPASQAPAVQSSKRPDGLTPEEARKQLDATKRQLESSRNQEQGLTRNVAALTQERARLNEALIRSGQQEQASEVALSATEKKLSELTDQVTAIRNSIADRKEVIVKMLMAMERIGRTPPPAFVTPRKDALDAVRSAMLMAKLFPELKAQADHLSGQLKGLVSLQDRISKERDAERQERDRLKAQDAQLDRLLAQKRQQIAQSESRLAAVRLAAEQQAEKVSNLGDLIKQLDAKVAEAEIAKYDAKLKAGDYVEIKPKETSIAFASPARMQPAIPFADAKGKLPLPAKGTVLTHFGDSEAFGGTAQGISIATRDRARVVSPADGWVVFAGPFRSYGQLLILNTGGGYHVLLAGMNRIDVSVGQFVLTGEPVAEMGIAGVEADGGGHDNAHSNPALYVEFRKDGHPINPAPWWADLSDKVQG